MAPHYRSRRNWGQSRNSRREGARSLASWGISTLTPIILLLACNVAGAERANEPTQVTLTVSGGASFGSYQAGVVWAVVEFMRQQRSRFVLAGTTGASAGNLNALLAALHWCSDAPGQAPEQSLYWNFWTRTGFEQLMPQTPAFSEAQRDGVFHTDYLGCSATECPKPDERRDRAIANGRLDPTQYMRLAEAIGATPAVKDCRVDIGMSLTDITPYEFHIGRVAGKTQRTVSFYTLRSRAGSAPGHDRLVLGQRIESDADIEALKNAHLGRAIVPKDVNGQVGLDQAVRLSMASAAFPLAFPPVQVSYCELAKLDGSRLPAVCDGPDSSFFFDGGVFDTSPIDLAYELYQSRHPQKSSAAAAAGVQHIYVDQDLRRVPAAPAEAKPSDPAAVIGLSGIFKLLKGAVSTARQYEVQSMWRSRNQQLLERVRTTDRFAPVVGAHLQSFGALLGKPFREHDFYVGVYDGMVFAAQNFMCHGESAPKAGRERCLQDALAAIIQQLPLSPGARGMARYLAEVERDYQVTPWMPPPAATWSEGAPLLRRIATTLGRELQTPAPDPACAGRPWNERPLCEDGMPRIFDSIRKDRDAMAQVAGELTADLGLPAGGAARDCLRFNSIKPMRRRWLAQDVDLEKPFEKHGIPFEDIKQRLDQLAEGKPSEQPYANSCGVDYTFLYLLKDPYSHFELLSNQMLHQLWRVEDQAAAHVNHAGFESLIELGTLAYQSETTARRIGWEFSPNTVPWNISYETPWGGLGALPYYIAFNARTGGTELGYKPTINVSEHVAVLVPFIPYMKDASANVEYFGVGLGIGWKVGGLTVPQIDLQAQCLNRWTVRGARACDGWAPEIDTYFLGGKLRFGLRWMPKDPDLGQDKNIVAATFGIADLPGLVYWAARISEPLE